MNPVHAVTGAFGYSGNYIAARLLDLGREVITLTHSANRPHPLRARIPAHPFNFDDPEKLTRALTGVNVLYNTYWVRFNHTRFTHDEAVANTLTLFRCAAEAGVQRVVHISIANPDSTSNLEYYRGKAHLEVALKSCGMSYAILRPTVLFGKEDILINNIAWGLRRFPVFALFGDGMYKVQPIYVDDLARLAVEAGESTANTTCDTVGPETFTYRDLVSTIGRAIGYARPQIALPPSLGWLSCALMGRCVGDVIVTREEIEGLMAGLLAVDTPPTGQMRLTDWLQDNAERLGRHYTSELARRLDRTMPYTRH